MDIAKFTLNVKRGENPDLILEVKGVKVKFLGLSNDQRFGLVKLIMGGSTEFGLPCKVELFET